MRTGRAEGEALFAGIAARSPARRAAIGAVVGGALTGVIGSDAMPREEGFSRPVWIADVSAVGALVGAIGAQPIAVSRMVSRSRFETQEGVDVRPIARGVMAHLDTVAMFTLHSIVGVRRRAPDLRRLKPTGDDSRYVTASRFGLRRAQGPVMKCRRHVLEAVERTGKSARRY